MDFDYIGIIFQVLFWIVAMTFMMRWFARSRLRVRPGAQAREQRHPPAILIIGLICLALSVAMVIGSFSAYGGVLPFVVGSAMIVLSAYLIADYCFARHVVDALGMDYGRPTGQRGRFAWGEVRRVAFNKRMNWYRIELESGVLVRIAGTQMGLPEFATHVLRHVPPAHIDPHAQTMLENASHGRLHGLGWWS